MNKIIFLLWVLIAICTSHFTLAAKGVYQTPKAFISASLGENSQAKMLWLTKEDKMIIANILNHKYNRMRIRYWQLTNETVWVLDEIGKEKPITIGVHIKEKKINRFKVLTFRESRGDEVRHDFYSQQFLNASLKDNKQLNQHIDGITGATLSVRATTKVARLALWLDAKVTKAEL